MILITKTGVDKEKCLALRKQIESLDNLIVNLLKEEKKIIVTDSSGDVLATIKNGIWIEEDINLNMAVYNYIIELNTEDEERYNFPASLKLIAEGKEELLKQQIIKGYKNKEKTKNRKEIYKEYGTGRENDEVGR